jgi:hypothetical protein
MIPIDPALKKPWARVTGNQEVMPRMDSQRRWPEVRQAISQRVVPRSTKGKSQTVHSQLMWNNENGARWTARK